MLNEAKGPCGEEWDDEYDGDMTSKPLWGFPNADGVSVACAETIVERNVRPFPCHINSCQAKPDYVLIL